MIKSINEIDPKELLLGSTLDKESWKSPVKINIIGEKDENLPSTK